ncbi:MAG: hypothetical protein WCL02_08265 [bacterium]
MIIRIRSPADHPIILSLTIVVAIVSTISAIGITYTKNFLTENTFHLTMYTIGIHTATILHSINFQFARLASIV